MVYGKTTTIFEVEKVVESPFEVGKVVEKQGIHKPKNRFPFVEYLVNNLAYYFVQNDLTNKTTYYFL